MGFARFVLSKTNTLVRTSRCSEKLFQLIGKSVVLDSGTCNSLFSLCWLCYKVGTPDYMAPAKASMNAQRLWFCAFCRHMWQKLGLCCRIVDQLSVEVWSVSQGSDRLSSHPQQMCGLVGTWGAHIRVSQRQAFCHGLIRKKFWALLLIAVAHLKFPITSALSPSSVDSMYSWVRRIH